MNFKNKLTGVAILGISLAATLSACNKDFFDIEDPNGIDSRIWDDPGAVGLS